MTTIELSRFEEPFVSYPEIEPRESPCDSGKSRLDLESLAALGLQYDDLDLIQQSCSFQTGKAD